MTVRYEEVTADPAKYLTKICEFVGVNVDGSDIEKLTSRVSVKSVGKWERQLSDSEVRSIQDKAGDVLEELGYLEAVA